MKWIRSPAGLRDFTGRGAVMEDSEKEDIKTADLRSVLFDRRPPFRRQDKGILR